LETEQEWRRLFHHGHGLHHHHRAEMKVTERMSPGHDEFRIVGRHHGETLLLSFLERDMVRGGREGVEESVCLAQKVTRVENGGGCWCWCV
jgi:hypothetical protein